MNSRIRHILLLSCVVAVGGMMGCIEREGRPVNPCTQVSIGQQISVSNVDKVDVLFMVDNSNSMAEEQVSLTAEFPRMVNILASGDFNQDGDLDDAEDFEPVRDLNVGVITSDMGTGGFVVPTCGNSDFGDDGQLRTIGRTDIAGCSATYPRFLNFVPADGAQTPAQFATDAACVATVGTGGCGFEQQLEAILKAGTPSVPTEWTSPDFAQPDPPFFRGMVGHGDGTNGGFFRRNAVLAIIPVTDEEDCSALDVNLFDPASPTYGTINLNLRCSPAVQAVNGVDSTRTLHSIDRYVTGYLNMRARPGLLIYAPIVGIPVDLAPGENNYPALISDTDGVRDVRMTERVNPEMETRLLPSCEVLGRGEAFPPIRIVQVAERLQEAGAGVTVQSICQESFQDALTTIISQIKSALGQACLPRELNREADRTVECSVVVTMPEGQSCSTLAGVDQEAAVEMSDGKEVCTLSQLVPTSEQISAQTPPTGEGWFYDDYTAEGQDNCQSGSDPYQRIAFSTQPPSGSVVRLECFQSVTAGDENQGGASIGDFCGGDTPVDCGSGQSLGGMALGCDPIQRSCGVPCQTSATCRDAGLVGFVCDPRPRSEVDPENFADDGESYNYCVNPTCS